MRSGEIFHGDAKIDTAPSTPLFDFQGPRRHVIKTGQPRPEREDSFTFCRMNIHHVVSTYLQEAPSTAEARRLLWFSSRKLCGRCDRINKSSGISLGSFPLASEGLSLGLDCSPVYSDGDWALQMGNWILGILWLVLRAYTPIHSLMIYRISKTTHAW